METRLKLVEERLARVERRERVQRGLLLAMFVGGGALLAVKPAVTQRQGNTVKAPFRVVDAEEKTLVQVDTLENATRLLLFDQAGKRSAMLVADPEKGGWLYINDKVERLIAGLGVW